MKKTYKILFALLIVFACTSWKNALILKDKAPHFTPPGTVWVKGNLYIDKVEVCNVHYREYLYWLKKRYVGVYGDKADSCCNSARYDSQVPDSTVWGKYNKYLYYPQYDNYPLVGITYEQASAYCQWRGDRVMEAYRVEYGAENAGKKYPRKVTYRLPTEAEWEYAASGGLDVNSFPYGENLSAKNSDKQFNVKNDSPVASADSKFDNSDLMAPVDSYKHNNFGIKNMIGNVAEMVQEKGVAKGGSFYHSLKESAIKNKATYSKPEYWLGFRCVCEVEW